MKTKRTVKLLALALCACIAFSACSLPFDFNLFDWFGSDGDRQGLWESMARRTVPFDEMVYERPDLEAISQRLDELAAEARTARSFNALTELDYEAAVLYEEYSTMQSLAFLRSYLNTQDAFYKEENRVLEEAGSNLSLLLTNYQRAVAEGPYAAQYRDWIGEYAYQSMENSLLLYADSVKELRQERSTLYLDYNDMREEYTVSDGGRSYTLDEIYTVDSANLYYQLSDLYFQQHAQSYADLYARLVALDKEIAAELGFESAAAMHYIEHERDYGPDDALAVCESVRTHLVPLVGTVNYWYFDPGAADMDAALGFLPGALAGIDPELEDAWEYMLQYGLYDLETRSTKNATVQFTTYIAGYDAPYLYTGWQDDFGSVATLVHEFGHFYDFWLRFDQSSAYSTDISEIYSQGLELLMLPGYGRLTDFAEDAIYDGLQDIFINSVVYQSMLEEFQLRLYQYDTFDATTLGLLYAELEEEYGFSSMRNQSGADHGWLRVAHFFLSPFYTFSYVASATTALQIWLESTENWRGAADTYLELIRAPQDQSYTDLLAGAGLQPVYSPGLLEEIAAYYETEFGALMPAEAA